jgi:hypothetical protein
VVEVESIEQAKNNYQRAPEDAGDSALVAAHGVHYAHKSRENQSYRLDFPGLLKEEM